MAEVEVSEEEVKRIVERVIKAEDEKLDMINPIGVVNDVQEIIEEEIE